MKFVERLLNDSEYRYILDELEKLEADRIYCRHNFTHFMDVARIAHLMNLQNNCGIDQEEIYLTALLHDIGRVEEYTKGISHAIAGPKLAGEILLRLGYSNEGTERIRMAISEHRNKSVNQEEYDLPELIKDADKRSRACFLCKGKESCKWSSEKKNRPMDFF